MQKKNEIVFRGHVSLPDGCVRCCQVLTHDNTRVHVTLTYRGSGPQTTQTTQTKSVKNTFTIGSSFILRCSISKSQTTTFPRNIKPLSTVRPLCLHTCSYFPNKARGPRMVFKGKGAHLKTPHESLDTRQENEAIVHVCTVKNPTHFKDSNTSPPTVVKSRTGSLCVYVFFLNQARQQTPTPQRNNSATKRGEQECRRSAHRGLNHNQRQYRSRRGSFLRIPML